MKFIVSKNDLLNDLQVLIKIVPSRATIPAIENFLFNVKENGIEITATDIDTTLTTFLELDLIEGTGKVAIEAKRLLEILKEFHDQPLTFEINQEDNELTITTESGEYKLPVFDAEDFPTVSPLDENNYSVSLSSDALFRGISKTFYAIGDDELRPQINGIYFQFKADSMTFVATDAHKLVRFKRFDYAFEDENSFILPKKPAELLRNIAAKAEDEVEISFDSKTVRFKIMNFTLIARLIKGEYPDYEAIIPQDNDKVVTIDRELFLSTIRRVSVFANETSKLVKFRFADNQVEITAQDIDFSISAYEKIKCNYEGEEITIGFKSTFILEILNNIESEEVSMSMSDSEKPALIYPTTPEYEYEDELVLLVPLQIE